MSNNNVANQQNNNDDVNNDNNHSQNNDANSQTNLNNINPSTFHNLFSSVIDEDSSSKLLKFYQFLQMYLKKYGPIKDSKPER